MKTILQEITIKTSILILKMNDFKHIIKIVFIHLVYLCFNN